MVNLQSIVTIDKSLNEIDLHEGQEGLEQWELRHAPDEKTKEEILKDRARVNKEISNLEIKYKYPTGSLKGLHLVMGDAVGLIKQLNKPEFKEMLTNPENVFIVKIRQNDCVIRTSIHRADQISLWEHVNSDEKLIKWPARGKT